MPGFMNYEVIFKSLQAVAKMPSTKIVLKLSFQAGGGGIKFLLDPQHPKHIPWRVRVVQDGDQVPARSNLLQDA